MTIPPMGCFPVAVTLAGLGTGRCVPWLNINAQTFNGKMSAAVGSLAERYHDLKIAHLDIYTPISGLVASPRSQGFTEARFGCCGTGTVEFGVLLCNAQAIGTCPNATTYVFWDAAHPTETANQVIADYLLAHGINHLVY
jgi:phospholipase/lecithinase/hemolysin